LIQLVEMTKRPSQPPRVTKLTSATAHKFKPELPGLPEKLQIRILQDVLRPTKSGYICPFYCKGFQPDLSVFNKTELSCIEMYGRPPIWSADKREKSTNLDLSLLWLNKDFNKVLSKFFYTHNVFVFNDARSCLWFLKRIGRTNLSQLTTVVFNLSSGYFLSAANRSIFDMCEERLWCKVFSFLRHRHQIQKCTIRFVGFNDLTDRKDLDDDDKLDITKSRIDLVDVLKSIHDIKEARLENEHCQFLGYEEREQLAMNMVHIVGPMDGMSIFSEVD
jgi:hypothetical protein